MNVNLLGFFWLELFIIAMEMFTRTPDTDSISRLWPINIQLIFFPAELLRS